MVRLSLYKVPSKEASGILLNYLLVSTEVSFDEDNY